MSADLDVKPCPTCQADRGLRLHRNRGVWTWCPFCACAWTDAGLFNRLHRWADAFVRWSHLGTAR